MAKKELNELLIFYPDDFFLNNLYGVILAEEKNYRAAILKFQKSVLINNNFTDGYYNLASVFENIGEYNSAIENFSKAISLKPDYFNAYFGLANVYSKKEDYINAKKNYKLCLDIIPNSVEVLSNLAVIFFKERQYIKAIEIYEKVINLNENYYLAFNNLGAVYREVGNLQKATVCITKAINIKLDYFEAYENLGLINYDLHNFNQAIFFYKKAIELNKNFHSAYTNLGNVYARTGEFSCAISYHQKALEIKDDFYEAYFNLAKTYMQTSENFSKALAVLEKVISIQKNHPDAYHLLGNYYLSLGEISLAIEHFERSYKFGNKNINFYKDYIFATLFSKNFSKEKYFKLTDNYFSLLEGNLLNKGTDFKFEKNKNNLRVGFVSGDFRNHPIGFFLEDILPFLKEYNEIEIFAFSNNCFEDSLTQRIKNYFVEWIPIYLMDDQEIIDQIKLKKIDILVDLSGHTSLNRLTVFFQKPAPIQVSWGGFLSSVGLKNIDYIITDPYVASENDVQFLEKNYILPHIWCHFSKPKFNLNINETTPAVKNGYITFGCFNNLAKINPTVIKLWSKILNLVPNSILFLKAKQFDDLQIKKFFLHKFYENDINSNRIILDKFTDRKTNLQQYNLIDIVLDPFPYTGGTTSFEASYMCVPILTLAGNTFISRCGVSININLDMKEWIAKDENDYLNKAINFSSNLENLNLFKKKLHDQKKITKLFDSKSFAFDLIRAFKNIKNMSIMYS